jgi:hypothetical protein
MKMSKEEQKKLVNEGFSFLKNDIDIAMITTVLASLAIGGDQSFNPKEQIIIDALRRSMTQLTFASIEDISKKLSSFDEDRLPGLVNHIKGIVHEMEFVAFENEDGDSVFAALHSETNHPGYDVKMIDKNTNESWEIQLKATDDKGYVQDWIAQHPDGEIVVTSEIAEKMELPSSGLSNEDLKEGINEFIDRMIELQEDETIWDYFPYLLPISVAFVVHESFKRYKKGEITKKQFRSITIKATGIKASKFAGIFILLSIPVVNIVTCIALITMLIKDVRKTTENLLNKKGN